MAGLYIHIPFCKQACSYCNFHFSTNLERIDAMVTAIANELTLRKGYLEEPLIDSIYLGGGTPSLLQAQHLNQLFDAIADTYVIAEHAEVTLEANPDDLDVKKLKTLAASPVNRLSIGVQSFRQEDLSLMHRVHNAAQAISCIQDAQSVGITNISVDLIYGTPGLNVEDWLQNLEILAGFNVLHWSCYALTVEDNTLLAHQVTKKQIKAPSDSAAEQHFLALQAFASQAGFEHYEISNFARPGHVAVHNANYWKQVPYLGLGPSAHSYDGKSRSWNVANNATYLAAIEKNEWPGSTELLTRDQKYNEYVMTGLRTKWGCSLDHLATIGQEFPSIFMDGISRFVTLDWVRENNQIFTLTNPGKLFADHIASELFVV